jgi:hypothetical protein
LGFVGAAHSGLRRAVTCVHRSLGSIGICGTDACVGLQKVRARSMILNDIISLIISVEQSISRAVLCRMGSEIKVGSNLGHFVRRERAPFGAVHLGGCRIVMHQEAKCALQIMSGCKCLYLPTHHTRLRRKLQPEDTAPNMSCTLAIPMKTKDNNWDVQISIQRVYER